MSWAKEIIGLSARFVCLLTHPVAVRAHYDTQALRNQIKNSERSPFHISHPTLLKSPPRKPPLGALIRLFSPFAQKSWGKIWRNQQKALTLHPQKQ